MNKMKLTVLAAALVVSSGAAVAATQGGLGSTSTGTSVVTIIKDDAVQISKVDDIDLGAPGFLTAPAVGSDDVCIFSSTGNYTVTASSANGLNLQSGAAQIPYTVSWDGNALTMGTATPSAPANSTQPDCGGVDPVANTNVSYEVTVQAAAFNAAASGTYTDTLTFVVSPL